jgi:hypothetical protein
MVVQSVGGSSPSERRVSSILGFGGPFLRAQQARFWNCAGEGRRRPISFRPTHYGHMRQAAEQEGISLTR